MNRTQLSLMLSDLTIIARDPFGGTDVRKVADFLADRFPHKTNEDVERIINLYVTGQLKWNDFDKLRNITVPLAQVHFIECLDGFYEKLPGGVYRYKGYERNENEWNAFLHERWFTYRRAYSHSADAIWVQMVSGIRTMIKELEIKANDEFSHWDELRDLKRICETKTEYNETTKNL